MVKIKKALPIINKYDHIDLFLDENDAGKKATASLMEVFPKCLDQGYSFNPYKDLNEFLMEKLG